MFNLLPISLLIAAIGGIVYIISNHLSEFSDQSGENGENGDAFQFNLKARFVEWANQLPLDNIKSRSLSLTQKMLHRTRILLLKADNKLMKIIGKIAERENGNKSDNGDAKKTLITDFWGNISKEKQEGIPENNIIKEPPLRQIERASPFEGGEIKIDIATQNEAAKKFFDIKPAKISPKISDSKPIKKTFKTNKSSK